jgi:hypothetical protein
MPCMVRMLLLTRLVLCRRNAQACPRRQRVVPKSFRWPRTTHWEVQDGALLLREVGLAFPLRKGRVDVVSSITSVVVVHCAWRGGREETGCFGRLEVAPRKGCCQPFARTGSLPSGRIGSPRVALHTGRVTGNRCSLDAAPSGGGSRPRRSFLHVARRWRQTRCSLRAAPR